MRVEQLQQKDLKDFIDYCSGHRNEVDDSYLYPGALESFQPDKENPTYIVKEEGRLIAAASLVLDEYYRKGKNGRFRIFHSEKENTGAYALLFSEILKHTGGLDRVFLFVPFTNGELARNMELLNFEKERYVFLLVNELKSLPEVSLPGEYSIRAYRPGADEEDWCNIRNTAFANLKGNSTPVTPDMVCRQMSQPDYLEGGCMLLRHGEKPVGIIRGAHDEYEGEPAMNIGPLAVLPGYQGKGLGRQLLRAALVFAGEKNYKKTVLSVNAENERAKELYLKEGFVQAEGVISYVHFLGNK